MGSLSSCFHVPDVQDDHIPASNNSANSKSCLCPKCFFQRFINKHRNIFRIGQTRNQQLSCSRGNKVGVTKKSIIPSDTPDDEDVCPTCLEDYTQENPKIMAKCSHHYHLSCIYEWMERSEKCPMCGKQMLFDE